MPFLGDAYSAVTNTEPSEGVDCEEILIAKTTETSDNHGTVGTPMITQSEDSQLISTNMTCKYISFLYIIENIMLKYHFQQFNLTCALKPGLNLNSFVRTR